MSAFLGIAAVCLVVALVLIVVELLIPSFGTIGVVAAGVLIAGGVCAFAAGMTWGGVYVGLSVVGVPMAISGGLRALPNTPIGRRVILSGPVTVGHAGAIPKDKLERLRGATGVTVTDLRPVGTARLGADRIDVETEADWIDAGTPIEVVRIDGMRIVVRPSPSAPTSAPPPAAASTVPPIKSPTEESTHA